MENVESMQTVETEFNKTTRSDIYNIDPRIIVPGNNIRKDYGDIPTLMNQIIEQGLLIALRVKKDPNSDKYIAIDGHRRLKAIHTAIEQGFDIKQVKCNVVPKNYTKENEIYDMLLCNTGKSLTDLEQAEGIRILSLAGYKDVEIAKRLGTNPVQIGNLLKLLEAPKEILNLVENKEISVTAVTSIIRHATELAKTENNEIDTEKKNNEIINIVKETIEEAKKTGSKATSKHIQVKEITDKFNRKTLLKFLSSLNDEFVSANIENEKTQIVKAMITELRTDLDMPKLAQLFK